MSVIQKSSDIEQKSVLVVGMGFVGLTLSAFLASRGVRVTGYDINERTVAVIGTGKSHFHEAGLNEAISGVLGKTFHVSSNEESLQRSSYDVVVITVGTPLRNGVVDESYIDQAWRIAAGTVRDGGLIILRSTVTVGTTRRLETSLPDVRSVQVAFCPERTVEGAALRELSELPQIVSRPHSCSRAAQEFFEGVGCSVIACESHEEAELIKLFSNVYRDLRFSIANLFEAISLDFGLHAPTLIDNANNGYARNDIPRPGFVGGPCLSKDAHILAQSLNGGLAKSLNSGDLTPFVLAGRTINGLRIQASGRLIREQLCRQERSPGNSLVIVAGIAFKGEPATDDTRDSPALDLISELNRSGVRVAVQDYEVPDESLTSMHLTIWRGSVGLEEDDVALVVIANNHRGYDRPDKLILEDLQIPEEVTVLRL